jgi:adenosine deaminase
VTDSETFIDALKRRDLAAIRRIPKADLHNHGLASGSRAFIRERTGHDITPVAKPLRSMAEMHAWFNSNILPVFKSLEPSDAHRLAREAPFVQATEDGVSRIEFGEDVWMVSQGQGTARELAAKLEDIHSQTAPLVEHIPLLGMSRHCSIRALDFWLAPFLEFDFFKSFDLSGDEFAQPIELFLPLYKKAKACGLRLKAHVGEWGTADDVWRAVELLELDEVQHGIAAATSPSVMRMLADNHIRLNVCPTSNVLLGRVEGIASHPIRKLFDAGIKVTINTDDALVFGAGVSDEFLSLYDAGVFTANELDTIRLNGLTDD